MIGCDEINDTESKLLTMAMDWSIIEIIYNTRGGIVMLNQ